MLVINTKNATTARSNITGQSRQEVYRNEEDAIAKIVSSNCQTSSRHSSSGAFFIGIRIYREDTLMLQQVVDFLAALFADTETILHPDAVTLPNFPRSLQIDSYSCGAKSIYCILQYYGKQCTPESAEEALKTDINGTAASDIKRVFSRYHLNCRSLRKPGFRDLKIAIDDECPVLITLNDGEHYAVVYGYSDSHIFVSNPSLNMLTGYGSIRCAITNSEFQKIWDKWGIIVSL
jgi:hypothetical protein